MREAVHHGRAHTGLSSVAYQKHVTELYVLSFLQLEAVDLQLSAGPAP
jgi:hypothetical protein